MTAIGKRTLPGYPPFIWLTQQHPPGDVPVCLADRNFQVFAIWFEAAEDSPEVLGVVQLSDMAEFVQVHVPNKVLWEEQQAPVYADVP